MLVVHIMLLFALLNPLVIPFGLLYFCVEAAVVKNQVIYIESSQLIADYCFAVDTCIRQELRS